MEKAKTEYRETICCDLRNCPEKARNNENQTLWTIYGAPALAGEVAGKEGKNTYPNISAHEQ